MARSIVIWGGPPYFGPRDSTHEEMARACRALGCDVLYLELEGDAGPFREAMASVPGPVDHTALAPDGIVVDRIPKVPLAPYALFGPSHWANMKLAEAQLERLAPVWRHDDPVIMHRGWFSSKLMWAHAEARHVYDCVDDHTVASAVAGKPGLQQRVLDEERETLEAADLTVCVSDVLSVERKPIARRCIVLPNAARPEMFAGTFAEPEVIAGLPRPRALFIGALTPKIDLALVEEAVKAAPEVSWIFAGDVCGVRVSRLPGNVKLLGETSHDDMPALAAHSDVGIAPLVVNDWNRASSPMKYCDYMAAGLPFVSTAMPAANDFARDVPGAVFIPDSAAEFAASVREAIALGPGVRDHCREWAREHTWLRRARAVLDEVDRVAPADKAGEEP